MLTDVRKILLILILVTCWQALAAPGRAQTAPAATPETTPAVHALVGAWLATDGTVFIFRKDGTFHGFDFRPKEIWGNWVTLSATRIGFQSLLHNESYQPQYAIIDKSNKDSKDYIVTGGNSFIKAARPPVEKAEAAVEVVVEPQVHHPGELSAPAKPDDE